MNVLQLIQDLGTLKANRALIALRNMNPREHCRFVYEGRAFKRCKTGFTLAEFTEVLSFLNQVEQMGGIGRCSFYLKGLQMNGMKFVKCPKSNRIYSRSELERAVNKYREYANRDED